MHSRFQSRALALTFTAAAAMLAAHSAHAISTSVEAATGTLAVGNGAPGDKNIKVEVGPLAGEVRVIDNLGGSVRSFVGIRTIRLDSGAGNDQIEFDINASQSLALLLNTGSGSANVKLQWKVPAGAAATTSSLSMTSGGGDVNVELGFESETRSSNFNWNTQFGGGNKQLKAGFAFKPGTATARKNLQLGNLGGGNHLVAVEVDNDASDARLTLNSGFAQDVSYKVVSDSPTARLDVDSTVRGAKQGIEVVSAATATNTWLRGGTANVTPSETKFNVAHLVSGSLGATLDFVPSGFGSKFEAKFEGPSPWFVLGGRLLGTPGNDEIRLLSNMVTRSTLQLDCGAGTDTAQAPVAAAPGCEIFSR